MRWLSHESDTDWGIVIGRFYSFVSDRCCWSWCCLIWLSKDSPSAAWISADIAWEEDLRFRTNGRGGILMNPHPPLMAEIPLSSDCHC